MTSWASVLWWWRLELIISDVTLVLQPGDQPQKRQPSKAPRAKKTPAARSPQATPEWLRRLRRVLLTALGRAAPQLSLQLFRVSLELPGTAAHLEELSADVVVVPSRDRRVGHLASDAVQLRVAASGLSLKAKGSNKQPPGDAGSLVLTYASFFVKVPVETPPYVNDLKVVLGTLRVHAGTALLQQWSALTAQRLESSHAQRLESSHAHKKQRVEEDLRAEGKGALRSDPSKAQPAVTNALKALPDVLQLRWQSLLVTVTSQAPLSTTHPERCFAIDQKCHALLVCSLTGSASGEPSTVSGGDVEARQRSCSDGGRYPQYQRSWRLLSSAAFASRSELHGGDPDPAESRLRKSAGLFCCLKTQRDVAPPDALSQDGGRDGSKVSLLRPVASGLLGSPRKAAAPEAVPPSQKRPKRGLCSDDVHSDNAEVPSPSTRASYVGCLHLGTLRFQALGNCVSLRLPRTRLDGSLEGPVQACPQSASCYGVSASRSVGLSPTRKFDGRVDVSGADATVHLAHLDRCLREHGGLLSALAQRARSLMRMAGTKGEAVSLRTPAEHEQAHAVSLPGVHALERCPGQVSVKLSEPATLRLVHSSGRRGRSLHEHASSSSHTSSTLDADAPSASVTGSDSVVMARVLCASVAVSARRRVKAVAELTPLALPASPRVESFTNLPVTPATPQTPHLKALNSPTSPSRRAALHPALEKAVSLSTTSCTGSDGRQRLLSQIAGGISCMQRDASASASALLPSPELGSPGFASLHGSPRDERFEAVEAWCTEGSMKMMSERYDEHGEASSSRGTSSESSACSSRSMSADVGAGAQHMRSMSGQSMIVHSAGPQETPGGNAADAQQAQHVSNVEVTCTVSVDGLLIAASAASSDAGHLLRATAAAEWDKAQPVLKAQALRRHGVFESYTRAATMHHVASLQSLACGATLREALRRVPQTGPNAVDSGQRRYESGLEVDVSATAVSPSVDLSLPLLMTFAAAMRHVSRSLKAVNALLPPRAGASAQTDTAQSSPFTAPAPGKRPSALKHLIASTRLSSADLEAYDIGITWSQLVVLVHESSLRDADSSMVDDQDGIAKTEQAAVTTFVHLHDRVSLASAAVAVAAARSGVMDASCCLSDLEYLCHLQDLLTQTDRANDRLQAAWQSMSAAVKQHGSRAFEGTCVGAFHLPGRTEAAGDAARFRMCSPSLQTVLESAATRPLGGTGALKGQGSGRSSSRYKDAEGMRLRHEVDYLGDIADGMTAQHVCSLRACTVEGQSLQALLLPQDSESGAHPALSAGAHVQPSCAVALQGVSATAEVDIALLHLAAATVVQPFRQWATDVPRQNLRREPARIQLQAQRPSTPGSSSHKVSQQSQVAERLLNALRVHIEDAAGAIRVGPRDVVSATLDAQSNGAIQEWSLERCCVLLNGSRMLDIADVQLGVDVRKQVVDTRSGALHEVKAVHVNIRGQSVVLAIPHDQDPGRLYVYGQLWADAVQRVCKTYVQECRQGAPSAGALAAASSRQVAQDGAAPSRRRTRSPGLNGPVVYVRVQLEEAAFRLECHHLERHLTLTQAVHRQTAVAIEALDSVLPMCDKAFVSHEAAVSAGQADVDAVPPAAQIFSDMLHPLLVLHRLQCTEVKRAADESRTQQAGHLLNVAVRDLSGTITVDGKDEASFADAVHEVHALDDASRGLAMARAQRVSLDVASGPLTVHVGTNATELAASSGLLVSGSVIMARLASAPPRTYSLDIPVGSRHTCTLRLPLSGARPPPKAYTNLRLSVSGAVFGLTAGLEPAFAALSRASKRLVPPSEVLADGTLPAVDPHRVYLAWWDRMRYQWRGKMQVECSNVTMALCPVFEAAPEQYHRRLLLSVQTLTVQCLPDAHTAVHCLGVDGTIYLPQHEERSRPDAPMLRVPFCSVPSVQAKITLSLKLPEGRCIWDHHVHPGVSLGQQPAQGPPRCPVELPPLLTTTAFEAYIDITAGEASESRRSSAAGSVGPNASGGTVYICEEILAFMKDLSQAFSTTPRYLRRAYKRSEDYWHRRTVLPAVHIKSIPELLSAVHLHVEGRSLAMRHHVVTADDRGELQFRPRTSNFKATLEFQSVPANAQTPSAMGGDAHFSRTVSEPLVDPPRLYPYRPGPALRQTLSSFQVNAQDASFAHIGGNGSFQCGAAVADGIESEDPGSVGQAGSVKETGVASLEGSLDACARMGAETGSSWDDMGHIASICIYQLPVPPSSADERRRPLMVLADDARLIFTEVTRDTVSSLVKHMMAPFQAKRLDPHAPAADEVGFGAELRETDITKPASLTMSPSGSDMLSDLRSQTSVHVPAAQLNLEELLQHRGQVVDVQQADFASTVSGGNATRSSGQKKTSTSHDKSDDRAPDEEDASLLWKVEVRGLQVALLTSQTFGTAHVAADTCTMSQSTDSNILNFDAEAKAVSLHILSHAMDPQNPLCWLIRGASGFEVPSDHSHVNPIREVLQPFHLHFHMASNRASPGTGAGAGHGREGSQTMQINIKKLMASTSCVEYQILGDVVTDLCLGPTPEVPVMTRHLPYCAADNQMEIRSLRANIPMMSRAMRREQLRLFGLTRPIPSQAPLNLRQSYQAATTSDMPQPGAAVEPPLAVSMLDALEEPQRPESPCRSEARRTSLPNLHIPARPPAAEALAFPATAFAAEPSPCARKTKAFAIAGPLAQSFHRMHPHECGSEAADFDTGSLAQSPEVASEMLPPRAPSKHDLVRSSAGTRCGTSTQEQPCTSGTEEVKADGTYKHLRDVLPRVDWETFEKHGVPLLRAYKKWQAGEEDALATAEHLHELLVLWLTEQASLMERSLVKLEEHVDMERTRVEEALIRRNRVQDLLHGVKLTLKLPSLDWTLVDVEGKDFLVAQIQDVCFVRILKKNRTGVVRIEIKTVHVVVLGRPLAISRRMPEGVMLSKLSSKPWARELFLLINVIRGKPTAEEVVYDHIDIKLHPVALQLDSYMINTLQHFFGLKDTQRKANSDKRRIEQAIGAIAVKRERRRRTKHQPSASVDQGATTLTAAPSGAEPLAKSLETASTTELSRLGQAAVPAAIAVPDRSAAHKRRMSTSERQVLTEAAAAVADSAAAARHVRSQSTIDEALALSLASSSDMQVADYRGPISASVEGAATAFGPRPVKLASRLHRYKQVVFSSTVIQLSLSLDQYGIARCRDKEIQSPERRYEDMMRTRPALLLSRYGRDLVKPVLKTFVLGQGRGRKEHEREPDTTLPPAPHERKQVTQVFGRMFKRG